MISIEQEVAQAGNFYYWGNRPEWLIALALNRDSEALDRSNWMVIKDDLMRRFDDDVSIVSTTHWAVGWVDYLVVRPGTPAEAAAREWQARLADYPVADEQHYSLLEYDEEWCVRCDRGTREQHAYHPELFRCPFRSEMEADEIRYKWQARRSA